MKTIGVLTSGGDSPGMNTALRSIVRTCAHYKIKCVGIVRGYSGLIEDNTKVLNTRSVRGIINKGGTFLYSARCDEFRQASGRKKAYKTLRNNNIDGLIVIGGDGSFTGALKLKDEFNFPVIGIPGTIDNDIFGTSHTLGYDTALNTVMDAIDKIRDSAISHDRLFFVEVMGKDAGYIALRSGIAIGAQEILIPEVNTKINDLIDSLKNSKKSGKTSSIIVVAEGYKPGKNVYQIADEIQEKLPNYQVRVSVLGHIQRGGRPSCFDRVLGTKMGVKAVELLKNAKTGIMVGTQHGKIVTVPLKKAISEKTKIDKDLLRISKIMNT
ncbi:MAG: 6-phosphofructokinase [Flavobacteriaceae bacterium]|jgi:6-phosphofructokinase 1|nr:6-phosphofructokinase [Flavobacteriaceae bacterium]MAQ59745.1 6-phosphofructokinase [Flavobacteriaceae bacterium]|tara:strand:- start:18 stop:992 length:975 start_codon:yes stop_codon:yes gene_type:complete